MCIIKSSDKKLDHRVILMQRGYYIQQQLKILLGLLAIMTMAPTDAQASGWHSSTGEKVLITTTVLSVAATSVASVAVLISNGIDLFGEPEPTTWNAGWDIALAVPNGILCAIGATNVNPQDDGKVNLTIAACTASTLLLSHGIWELLLLDKMGPSNESLEDKATMSFGPALLDARGTFGLGIVGRF
jgi:hypothetical protein